MDSFYCEQLIPLCWFGFGSVGSLMKLPVTVFLNLVAAMRRDDMVKEYVQFRG